jgi:hypothetical protein
MALRQRFSGLCEIAWWKVYCSLIFTVERKSLRDCGASNRPHLMLQMGRFDFRSGVHDELSIHAKGAAPTAPNNH